MVGRAFGVSVDAGLVMLWTMVESDARQDRYKRFSERVELPMLVAALLLVPVLVMPAIEDLSASSLRALTVLGTAIWLMFVAEYLVRLWLAPDRRRMVMTHKLDLLMVLAPVLRPLRLVRLVRLAQAGTVFARARGMVGRIAGRSGFGSALGVVGAIMVASGGLVAIAEDEQAGSTIDHFGDGLWWALVTCTTVGYGDEFPVTATGRVIAVFLMLTGIAGVSVVTANIAAYFVENDVESSEDFSKVPTGTDRGEQMTEFQLHERLDRLEQKLDLLLAQPDATGMDR